MVWPHPPLWMARRLPRLRVRPRRLRRVGAIAAPQAGHLRRLDAPPPVELREEEEDERILYTVIVIYNNKYFNF
jgi:hypothetical protein